MAELTTTFTKATHHIYRDCLRLIHHVAGRSTKGDKLRQIIRTEFKKNAHVKDLVMIENLKSHAIRGLANYLVLESSSRDVKFREKMINFVPTEDVKTETKPDDTNSFKQDRS